MPLLVIESPGKQKTIQQYMGKEWTVVASLGHLRGLSHDLEFLQREFEPTYEWIKEKSAAMKHLKDAAKGLKPTEIYLAADKDFEGEQIAYSVCLLLKLNPRTAHRVTFTEITEKAIRAAIASPTTIDMNRVHTQQCRAMLDLLIGFTISPLVCRYVAPTLSAGRCQTPALRLVVEREDQIRSFAAETSWGLKASFSDSDGISMSGTAMDDLADEDSVMIYLENVHLLTTATVKKKTVTSWTERAPEPLITSTMQQQASALYTADPKTTMRAAQRLYEAGHITYMRTDHAVLSQEAKTDAEQWVIATYGAEYIPLVPAKKRGSKKQELAEAKEAKEEKQDHAQEAHEAIRPTHIEYTELEGADWSTLERKLYRLIWQRTVQSVMTPVRGEQCVVLLQINGDEDMMWSSTLRHTIFDGWRRACAAMAQLDDSDQEQEQENHDGTWTRMASYQVGDIVTWQTIYAFPKETRAKPRYTEATLIRELETYGIGRPSTYASLLATLHERNYVEQTDLPARSITVNEHTLTAAIWPPCTEQKKKNVGGEKRKLVPTPLGRSVLEFAMAHFADLFDYRFTAAMEHRLDQIAEGKEDWKTVLSDMWNSYKDRYMTMQSGGTSTTHATEHVKDFGDGIKAIQSKKGLFLLKESESKKKEDTVFYGWPPNCSFQKMTAALAMEWIAAAETAAIPIGEWQGRPIIKKKGKFGTYLECGEIHIPFKDTTESIEELHARFAAKQSAQQSEIEFKEYLVRKGPYGYYIMRRSSTATPSKKKPIFVPLAASTDPHKLTYKDIDDIYKAKSKQASYPNRKKIEVSEPPK